MNVGARLGLQKTENSDDLNNGDNFVNGSDLVSSVPRCEY